MRVALVTGAGRGLGRAHALALARNGVAVVVNDVGASPDGRGSDPDPASETVAQITARGGRAVSDFTDVASIEGGAAAVVKVMEAFGRIDIVINNAGFASGGGTLEEPVEAEIDALLAVHVKGALGTMRAALPHMRAQHYGRIVNTVSEVAFAPRSSGAFAYAAAKAALWSVTLAASRYTASDGITVNGISPGARTRMNAALLDAEPARPGRPILDLDPDHVARVVAYLASEEAGDITGRIIHAAGGQVREYTIGRSATSGVVERILDSSAH